MPLTVLTVGAIKSRLTSASVPIQSTVTRSTILTGIAVTVIYLYNIRQTKHSTVYFSLILLPIQRSIKRFTGNGNSRVRQSVA